MELLQGFAVTLSNKNKDILTKATKKILLQYVIAPLLMCLFLWVIYQQLLQKGNLEEQWIDLKRHWANANKGIFLVVLLLAPLNWCIEAMKWRIMMLKIQRVSVWTSFKAILTGIAFGIVTPGKVGDFAGKILYISKGKKLNAAVATLSANVIQVLASSSIGYLALVYMSWAYPSAWLQSVLLIASVGVALFLMLIIGRKRLGGLVLRFPKLKKVFKVLRVLKRYDSKDVAQVFGLSLLRFLTYTFQFLLLANALNSGIPWADGYMATLLMFWLITMIPSLFLSDIGVRGFLASLLFMQTNLAINDVAMLTSSYIIWLLNLVLPAVVGSVFLLTIRNSKKSKINTNETN